MLRMNRMTIPVLLLGMIAASPLAASADATFALKKMPEPVARC
jgi:hypothetical protein